ncbi:MAG TPA: PadR family transcriptional regulator [Methanomassiliicoccales archaeon]|nr:PadR family transcriptional regulator [Methanomassiliicoccales archaeon]
MAWALPQEEVSRGFQKYGFKAGFLKLVVLKLIARGPTHGYALIKEIEKATDAEWSPSPGSIYPALQELEVDGLIEVHNEGRRRMYAITSKGQETLKQSLEHASEAMRHLTKLLAI